MASIHVIRNIMEVSLIARPVPVVKAIIIGAQKTLFDTVRNFSTLPTEAQLRLTVDDGGFSSFNWNGGAVKKTAPYEIEMTNGLYINAMFGKVATDAFTVPVRQDSGNFVLEGGKWKQVLPDGTKVDVGGGNASIIERDGKIIAITDQGTEVKLVN